MQEKTIIQGRTVAPEDIEQVLELIAKYPTWSQYKLSVEICRLWNWRNDKGRIKDIACRSLLRKMESKGFIRLPARRRKPVSRMKDQHSAQQYLSFLSDISTKQTLAEVTPLTITIVPPKSADGKLFAALLAEHHYLGYKGSVGEHLAYMVRDCHGGILACLLFGAAAWKVASRDQFVGWQAEQRQRNLKLIANNMRFLLLPKIPHLASHLLGRVARRLSGDWVEKYGHPIVLLETFVEVDRFTGTCYRAANWLRLGQTQGRSRNDVEHKLKVAIKDVLVYPLTMNFREKLCS